MKESRYWLLLAVLLMIDNSISKSTTSLVFGLVFAVWAFINKTYKEK